jgi:hypothetical protein
VSNQLERADPWGHSRISRMFSGMSSVSEKTCLTLLTHRSDCKDATLLIERGSGSMGRSGHAWIWILQALDLSGSSLESCLSDKWVTALGITPKIFRVLVVIRFFHTGCPVACRSVLQSVGEFQAGISVDAPKFIFQVTSLTSLSPSLPTWHLLQTLDLTRPAGGTA